MVVDMLVVLGCCLPTDRMRQLDPILDIVTAQMEQRLEHGGVGGSRSSSSSSSSQTVDMAERLGSSVGMSQPISDFKLRRADCGCAVHGQDYLCDACVDAVLHRPLGCRFFALLAALWWKAGAGASVGVDGNERALSSSRSSAVTLIVLRSESRDNDEMRLSALRLVPTLLSRAPPDAARELVETTCKCMSWLLADDPSPDNFVVAAGAVAGMACSLDTAARDFEVLPADGHGGGDCTDFEAVPCASCKHSVQSHCRPMIVGSFSEEQHRGRMTHEMGDLLLQQLDRIWDMLGDVQYEATSRASVVISMQCILRHLNIDELSEHVSHVCDNLRSYMALLNDPQQEVRDALAESIHVFAEHGCALMRLMHMNAPRGGAAGDASDAVFAGSQLSASVVSASASASTPGTKASARSHAHVIQFTKAMTCLAIDCEEARPSLRPHIVAAGTIAAVAADPSRVGDDVSAKMLHWGLLALLDYWLGEATDTTSSETEANQAVAFDQILRVSRRRGKSVGQLYLEIDPKVRRDTVIRLFEPPDRAKVQIVEFFDSLASYGSLATPPLGDIMDRISPFLVDVAEHVVPVLVINGRIDILDQYAYLSQRRRGGERSRSSGSNMEAAGARAPPAHHQLSDNDGEGDMVELRATMLRRHLHWVIADILMLPDSSVSKGIGALVYCIKDGAISFDKLIDGCKKDLMSVLVWRTAGSDVDAKRSVRALSVVARIMYPGGNTGASATNVDDLFSGSGASALGSRAREPTVAPRNHLVEVYFLFMLGELSKKLDQDKSARIKKLRRPHQGGVGSFYEGPSATEASGGETQLRALRGVHQLLLLLWSAGEEAIVPVLPKILATMKHTLQSPLLRAAACMVWSTIIAMLPDSALPQYMVSIVVCLLPCLGATEASGDGVESKTSSVGSETRTQATDAADASGLAQCCSLGAGGRELSFTLWWTATASSEAEVTAAVEALLHTLIVTRGVTSSGSFSFITSLPVLRNIPSLAVVLERERGGANISFVAQLEQFRPFLGHDNPTVAAFVLKELRRYLQTNQSELHHKLILAGTSAAPVVYDLVRDLLMVCRRPDCSPAVSIACAECLGTIGAVDPLRLASAKGKPVIDVKDTSGAPELSTVPLAVKVISHYLVKVLTAARDAGLNDRVSYAIQELLKYLCDLAADRDGGAGVDEEKTSSKARRGKNSSRDGSGGVPSNVTDLFASETMDVIAPFFKTEYEITKFPSRNSPPFYSSGMRFDKWLATWTNYLIGKTSGPQTSLFLTCQGVIKQDRNTALFLLPYLVQNIVCRGDDEQVNCVREEIITVLQEGANVDVSASVRGGGGTDYNSWLSSAQTIFSLLDQLSTWLEHATSSLASERIRKARAERSSSSSSRGGSGRESRSGGHRDGGEEEKHDPYRAKDGVRDLLRQIPQMTLSEAAFRCKAYARSLLHLESHLRENHDKEGFGISKGSCAGSTESSWTAPFTRQQLADVQTIYSGIDEPDGMYGIAALRAQLQGCRTTVRETILDNEHAGQWDDALMCYEQLLQSPTGTSSLHTASLDMASSSSSSSSSSLSSSSASSSSSHSMSGSAGGPVSDSCDNDALLHDSVSSKVSGNDTISLDHHAGILTCLANMGHYETVLHHARGISSQRESTLPLMAPYAIDAAWRIGSWSRLEDWLHLGTTAPPPLQTQRSMTRSGFALDRGSSSGSLSALSAPGKSMSVMPNAARQGGGEGLDLSGRSKLSESEYNVELGSALLAAHQGKQDRFEDALSGCRRVVMSALAAASMESYERSYPQLVRLSILQELEDSYNAYRAMSAQVGAPKTLVLGAVGSGKQRSLVSRHVQADMEPGARVDARLRMMTPSLRMQEPMLAVRRAMYRIRGLRKAEGESWVRLARLARSSGDCQVASHALMNAAALDADSVTIERAKLLREQGDLHRALLELEPVEPDLADLVRTPRQPASSSSSSSSSKRGSRSAATEDIARLNPAPADLAERLLLATNWIQDSGNAASDHVLLRYNTVIKLNPRHEDGFFFLAKYHDFLLHRLGKTEQKVSTSGSSSSGRSGQSQMPWPTNVVDHVLMALENYGTALQYGHKYLFQSLPRFLTLWLDRTQALAKLDASSTSSGRSDRRGSGSSGRRGLNSIRMERAAGDAGGRSSRSSVDDSQPSSVLGARLNAVVSKFSSSLPAYQWYYALAQILSRMGHPHAEVVGILQSIIAKIMRFYPAQSIWTVIGVTQSEDGPRKEHVQDTLKQLRKHKPHLDDMSTAMELLFQELIELAMKIPSEKQPLTKRTIGRRLGLANLNIAMPLQQTLTACLPVQNGTMRDEEHEAFPYQDLCVQRFGPDVKVMNSKERPKKIGIMASDGAMRHFLCKAEKSGDLRKDSRMMELNTTINRLLQQDPEGRRRKLRVRTYAVICLNEQCGLLEWVPQTVGMRHVISRTYQSEGLKQPARINKEFRANFDRVQQLAAEGRSNAIPEYRRTILSRFPPRLHKWFMQHFPVPTAWYVYTWVVCWWRRSSVTPPQVPWYTVMRSEL